jgi:TorA maturation chaperone TorD
MVLESLAGVIELLSEVFLDPEADVKLRARALADDASLPAGLREALRELAEASGNPREQSVEYVRLFLHGTTGATVHPYESVQLKGRLMDPDVLGDLKALFARADIRPRADLAMPPDHIGLELELLGYLLRCARTGGAEETEALARDFMAAHVAPFSAALAAPS